MEKKKVLIFVLMGIIAIDLVSVVTLTYFAVFSTSIDVHQSTSITNNSIIENVSCIEESYLKKTIIIDNPINENISNIVSLDNYLVANPLVKNYIDNLDITTKSYFYSEFTELDTTGNIILDTNINKIQAAKIVRSVWIDKNNIVPWKLNNYSNEDLIIIFTYNTNFVYDCDPMNTYQYVKNDIRTTKIDTISAIIDSLRRYHHKIGSSSKTCIKEVLPQDVMGGCHVSSRLMADLITSLNIPAYYRYNPETQNWYVGGHGELVIPGIGYIPHGDNIYGTTIMRAIPSSELIIPWDFLQNNIRTEEIDPSYKFGSGENKIERRYTFDLLSKYPPNMHNSNIYTTCLEYAHEMGDGVANIDEITQMAQSWNCMCHSNSECDDSNNNTEDICNNPNTIQSSCSHIIPECIIDNDCNSLNKNYCLGSLIKYAEGRCTLGICTEKIITSTCDKTCGAQCVKSSECNDNNPYTNDICSRCTCRHTQIRSSAKECTDNGMRWHYTFFDLDSINKAWQPQTITPKEASNQGKCSDVVYQCYYKGQLYDINTRFNVNGHWYTCGKSSRLVAFGEKADSNYTWYKFGAGTITDGQAYDGGIYDGDSGAYRCAMARGDCNVDDTGADCLSKGITKENYRYFNANARFGQDRCCGDDAGEVCD